MELILFIGIQAAGKSTFYTRRLFDTHLRLDLDMLRTRHCERSVLQTCLATQQRLVVDNTNPTLAERAAYIAPARAAGFRVTGYFFEPPPGAASNATRPRPTGTARRPVRHPQAPATTEPGRRLR
ncbi:AAA family ATPase [Stutzerimonas nosocomialis]|uniref:AAA family ATPase n=1 Tax=Stutzerimonas nosocomialis TaxID=1056496 RepID=UPI001F50174D|nr:AAA family ATPase [Stutzerimonas nosocomialis]